MKIDFLVHLFPDALAVKTIEKLARIAGDEHGDAPHYTDGTLRGTLEKMDVWGVDRAVTQHIATSVHAMHKVNDFAASVRSDEKTVLHSPVIAQDKTTVTLPLKYEEVPQKHPHLAEIHDQAEFQEATEVDITNLSLEDAEKEMISLALEKHSGKRKLAANELGISERTLYRKIKEYNLEKL